MNKKYSEEKRKAVIEARKTGATIAQFAAQTGVSMAERFRIVDLSGYKSRVQISDNPAAENLIFLNS